MGQRVISTQERLGKAGETGDNGVDKRGWKWKNMAQMRHAVGILTRFEDQRMAARQNYMSFRLRRREKKKSDFRMTARQNSMSFRLRRREKKGK